MRRWRGIRRRAFCFHLQFLSVVWVKVETPCTAHCLFQWLMTQEGPSVLLLLCCTFFCPPPSPPTASLLRGLRMNSHCHVQGRVAQGQLIAFMIMISRQIYRARSEHIFQVLPPLLAQMGGGGVVRRGDECTASGWDFLFKNRSRFLTHYSWMRWVNPAHFSCKRPLFCVTTLTVSLILCCNRDFSAFSVIAHDLWKQSICGRQRLWLLFLAFFPPIFSVVWTFYKP